MNPKMSQLRKKAMALPLLPGVYIMHDKSGKIIYIGKAKALKNRVSQYFGSQNNHAEKVRRMVDNVDDFEYIISDDLNMDGNKVKQVLNFLLERSLFDNTLFQSDKVLTSAGTQRRYQAMVKARALKNPITVERFWLLQEEETETFIKVNPSLNNSENYPNNSKKNNDNSEKNNIKGKERKGEYIYTAPPGTYFADSSLNEAFLLFLKVRQNNGDRLTDEQIQLLKEELSSMSDKPEELTAIVKKSVMSGWKTFYPLKKSRGKKTESKNSKNRFNNFQQREYDFNDYEKQLLNKGQEG